VDIQYAYFKDLREVLLMMEQIAFEGRRIIDIQVEHEIEEMVASFEG
jgi:hypothetical protein